MTVYSSSGGRSHYFPRKHRFNLRGKNAKRKGNFLIPLIRGFVVLCMICYVICTLFLFQSHKKKSADHRIVSLVGPEKEAFNNILSNRQRNLPALRKPVGIRGLSQALSGMNWTDPRGRVETTFLNATSKGKYPLFSSLVRNKQVIGNVSWLLDFAIVGFPKCGTTTMSRYLSEATASLPDERFDLVSNQTASLVQSLYSEFPLDTPKKRGFKCPQDISSENSAYLYSQYFPNTKLIVGIRHPVRWFESFYNYRISNNPWKELKPTHELTGRCFSGSQGICAWRANFHDFLARLGKTNVKDAAEAKLLSLHLDTVPTPVGNIFLYDLQQLADQDSKRQETFRSDLAEFVGLTEKLPEIPHIDTKGKHDGIAGVKELNQKRMIDICTDEHVEIRNVLMDKSKRTARWVRQYFLKSEDVMVSSKQYFLQILDDWEQDPCSQPAN